MLSMKFCLLITFAFLYLQSGAQVLVKEHNFSYSYSDHLNCEFENLDITYPVFYYKNGQPITVINDSVQRIVQSNYFEDNAAGYSFRDVTGKTDTSILINDTATIFECDEIALMPMEGSLNYTILINENQLLSFAMRLSYHAGSGGHDALYEVAPFCFDLKTNKWADVNALFPDDFDTILRKSADSLFALESMNEILSDDDQFPAVAIAKGNLTFYYFDHWGGNYFYRDVIIPYEEYEKHLAKRYRKLLKPAAPKPAVQKH